MVVCKDSRGVPVTRFGVSSTSTLLEASLLCANFDDDNFGEKSGTLRLQKTFGAEAILDWFREFEAPHLLSAFRCPEGIKIPAWFHGNV